MDTNTPPDAAQGIAITPETNPLKLYGIVCRFAYREDFDPARAEGAFRGLWKVDRRRFIKAGNTWLGLSVRPGDPEGFRLYAARTADGREVVRVTVSRPHYGMVIAERVEVEPGFDEAAVAVFREAGKDAMKMGARLLPAPPGNISDTEMMAWWEMDRFVVAYYPECGRLGLGLEGEEAEDLEQLRHLFPVLALKDARERMLKERGEEAVAFFERIGALLTEAFNAGCKRPADMAIWLNRRGVKARISKGWTENSVCDVARHYEKISGVRLLNPQGRRSG